MMRRQIGTRRPLALVADAMAVAGVVALVLTLAGVIPFHGERVGWSYARDLYAYWIADPADPYSNPVGVGFAYLYSPLFLQVLLPLKLLPFDLLAVVWLAGGLAALWWLRALWMLAIPGVSTDLLLGNVNVFIAVAIVLALTRPELWAVPLLTKLSPAVGALWHPLRGEWRSVLRGTLVVGGVVAVSFAIQPGAWLGWFELLATSVSARGESTSEFGPLTIRLPIAALLVVIGARFSRPWVLPIAALMAMPVIWPATLALLAALPRLVRWPGHEPAAEPAPSAQAAG